MEIQGRFTNPLTSEPPASTACHLWDPKYVCYVNAHIVVAAVCIIHAYYANILLGSFDTRSLKTIMWLFLLKIRDVVALWAKPQKPVLQGQKTKQS